MPRQFAREEAADSASVSDGASTDAESVDGGSDHSRAAPRLRRLKPEPEPLAFGAAAADEAKRDEIEAARLDAAHPRPATVADLLRLDAEGRADPRASRLIPLGALRARYWDYSLPTIVGRSGGGRSGPGGSEIRPKAKILADLRRKFPALAGLDMRNLLVAGGCVASLVSREADPEEQDVDVFVHGLTPAEADDRVRALIIDLAAAAFDGAMRAYIARAEHEQSRIPAADRATLAVVTALIASLSGVKGPSDPQIEVGRGRISAIRPARVSEAAWGSLPHSLRHAEFDKFRAVRSAGSVTIELGATIIQVVLRLYSGPSEVLHGFDVGASAVGYDGEEIWFTPLSRDAHERQISIVDTSRRSASYEARLRKYQLRGFDIVLPRLNVAALGLSSNFKYGLPEVVDLPRLPFAFRAINGNLLHLETYCRQPETAINAAGGDYSEARAMLGSNEQAAHRNIKALVHDEPNLVHTASGDAVASEMLRILSAPPRVTLEDIHAFYQELRNTKPDRLLNIKQASKWLPAARITDLVAAAVDGRAREAIDAAIPRQLDLATKAWKARVCDVDRFPLPWITENPGAQLTSSFAPIWEPPAAWYGPLMLPEDDAPDALAGAGEDARAA